MDLNGVLQRLSSSKHGLGGEDVARRWGTSSGVARRARSIGCSAADWERLLSSSSPQAPQEFSWA
jgi:hypothetical protein